MLGAAATLVAGCQAAHLSPSPAPASWLARQGGVERGAESERVRRAANGLAGEVAHALTAEVVASRHVGAYAWPSGEIYVTQGLLDLLDDGELAAALAHEIGHLLRGGHLARATDPASLLSGRADERAADDCALALLRAVGIRPTTMASMLTKVSRVIGADTPTGRSLARRAARVGARPAATDVDPGSYTDARPSGASRRGGACAPGARPAP